jgi:flagellar assembly protein FliH
MKFWPETIQLTTPLRDARLLGPVAVMSSGDPALQDQWHTSYELGRIEGEKALSEQLLKQRAELHEIFQGLLNSLRQAVPQVVHDTETMVVSLALEVAQKIVSDLPISVPMVEAAVRDALTQVEGTAQLTVRLHPADLELLQSSASPILASCNDANEFRFLGSPEVTRGGCLVQTRFGTVDARRETKFDLIKRSLLS